MPASTYERDNRLNVARGVAYPAVPDNLYASLHDDDPGATGANELDGSGYARVAIATELASWSAPSTNGSVRQIANAAVVSFGPAGGVWSPATHVGLWDAATGGNFIRSASLDDPRVASSGDVIRFSAGELVLTEQ